MESLKIDINQEGIELDFEYCEKSACAFQYFQSCDGLATLMGKTLFHHDRKELTVSSSPVLSQDHLDHLSMEEK